MNFFKKFNKLNFKDKTKNKKLLSLAVTIFGIGLIITGTSAAYLISEHAGSTNTITAGTLVLSLPSESEGITLSGALPVTDEVGLLSDKAYSFTLKNAGTIKMEYKIFLKNKCSTSTSVTVDGVSVTPDICIPSQYIKVGLKTGTGNYEIVNLGSDELVSTGILETGNNLNFEMKIWLDENTPSEYNGIVNDVLKNVIYYGNLELEGNQIIKTDPSNANQPVLASNMIPVTYDSKNNAWVKADSSNKKMTWFNYAEKRWANAVTVTESNGLRDDLVAAPVGTPIPMERINTMMVWIPRFNATGDTANYNSTLIQVPCSQIEYSNRENHPSCYGEVDTLLPQDDIESVEYTCTEFPDIFSLDNDSDTLEKDCSDATITMVTTGSYNGITLEEIIDFIDDQTIDGTDIVIQNTKANLFIKTNTTTISSSNTIYNPGAFNITFVDKNTPAHDAFDFGGAVSGFWMGKFENSSDINCTPASSSAVGEGCNLTTIKPKVLPNQVSWRGAMVSTFFYDMQNMTESGNPYGFDKTADTHMLKNNEWGAVAYLTQSIYGRCTSSTSCSKIGINNDENYITGYGAQAGSYYSDEKDTYETELGQVASTTGNIYGVYDMSGGAEEYVMGLYWDGTNYWSSGSADSNRNSGFNGCLGNTCESILETGMPFPSNNKYFNLYTTKTDYINSGLQHALTETGEWYGEDEGFVDNYGPWFLRGGNYGYEDWAGIFNCSYDYGESYDDYGSRLCVIIR